MTDIMEDTDGESIVLHVSDDGIGDQDGRLVARPVDDQHPNREEREMKRRKALVHYTVIAQREWTGSYGYRHGVALCESVSGREYLSIWGFRWHSDSSGGAYYDWYCLTPAEAETAQRAFYAQNTWDAGNQITPRPLLDEYLGTLAR